MQWERHLAALCVHRPDLAARLRVEYPLQLAAIQHPLVRRMIEIAQTTPPGEEIPLTSLPPTERQFAAKLLLESPPELMLSSRTTDLDQAIADCMRLVDEAAITAQIGEVRRRMTAAKERGDDIELASLAARVRELSTASPRLRRHSRAE
jgi:hypothetical protein